MIWHFHDGGVNLDMEAFTRSILSYMNITSSVATPAVAELFSISVDTIPLSESNRKIFYSVKAKLLYLATRSEIILAVNFLTTRVLKATAEDFSKLIRVLKYLHGTTDHKLTLKIGA